MCLRDHEPVSGEYPEKTVRWGLCLDKRRDCAVWREIDGDLGHRPHTERMAFERLDPHSV